MAVLHIGMCLFFTRDKETNIKQIPSFRNISKSIKTINFFIFNENSQHPSNLLVALSIPVSFSALEGAKSTSLRTINIKKQEQNQPTKLQQTNRKQIHYSNFNQTHAITTEIALTHRLSLLRESSHVQLSPRVPLVSVQLDSQAWVQEYKP